MKKRIFCLLGIFILLLTACSTAKTTTSDGQYTIDVKLSGGSGKATITTPAMMTITDGKYTATIIWSSPFYEWVKIGDVQYLPVQEDGNATFEIPVELDKDVPISAQTVAMSEPHVIDYTLYFDSTTLKPAGN